MSKPKALITSVHNDTAGGTTRINLRWEGKHEIGDFEIEKLGETLNSEAEGQNSGWILVPFPAKFEPGDSIPLRSGA
jgi:hypothetical protein